MATILNNHDAEALLLDIRTARTADIQVPDDGAGAFLVFPTSVVVARPGGGLLVFPLTTDTEPGTVVRGDGGSDVGGMVDGVSVSGRFTWGVAAEPGSPGSPVAPAGYRFRRRGREIADPPWAAALPSSRTLVAEPPAALGRQRRRLLRQGRAAEYWLLKLTERVVRQSCRGPMRRALNHRPQVDVDDVVQRGMQVACRLLPVYASADRPPCSWLGMLRLDGRRDMHREVTRLDWLPPEAACVVAVAEAAGVGPGSDPADALAALVEAAGRIGLRLPRVGPRQVSAALGAPSLVALDAIPPAHLDTVVARGRSDLDGVDDQWGWAAAAAARLVSDDPQLVSLAGQGDTGALGQVGSQLLDALKAGRESPTATRRRCWTDFQSTGRLFDTEASRQRFDSPATAVSLAAIDESLRHAAGIGGDPAGEW